MHVLGKGYQNTKRILSALSKKLYCSSDEIIIMSTGIIGRQLPINKIVQSISQIVISINCSLKSAASAIMTTDKYPKYLTKSYMLGRKKIRFRGLCKGAGMIEPNMATMLSFIETDASLSKGIY